MHIYGYTYLSYIYKQRTWTSYIQIHMQTHPPYIIIYICQILFLGSLTIISVLTWSQSCAHEARALPHRPGDLEQIKPPPPRCMDRCCYQRYFAPAQSPKFRFRPGLWWCREGREVACEEARECVSGNAALWAVVLAVWDQSPVGGNNWDENKSRKYATQWNTIKWNIYIKRGEKRRKSGYKVEEEVERIGVI